MTGTFRRGAEVEVHRGPVVQLAIGQFTAPDGEQFERQIVHHPGAVAVVPVDGDEAVLIRQYRPAIDRDLLEIPAGKRDVAGEAPEVTAGRELVEEVGLRAGTVELLGCFYNSPGFCDEYTWCYLATELEPVDREAQGAEERHLRVERLALAEVPGMIASGELVDAKSIIGLLLARSRLRDR